MMNKSTWINIPGTNRFTWTTLHGWAGLFWQALLRKTSLLYILLQRTGLI